MTDLAVAVLIILAAAVVVYGLGSFHGGPHR